MNGRVQEVSDSSSKYKYYKLVQQMGGDFFGQPASFSPQASAGQFIVTPSMVIPEADWEAAFSSPAPAAPKPEPTLTEPPQVGRSTACKGLNDAHKFTSLLAFKRPQERATCQTIQILGYDEPQYVMTAVRSAHCIDTEGLDDLPLSKEDITRCCKANLVMHLSLY